MLELQHQLSFHNVQTGVVIFVYVLNYLMVHFQVIVPVFILTTNFQRIDIMLSHYIQINYFIISSLTLQNILNFIIVFVFQSKEYVVKE